MSQAIRFEVGAFFLAVQFLTRLPIPAVIDFSPERFAAAPRYYPLVGGLIGLLSGGVFWLCDLGLGAGLAVIVSTAAGMAITGAFHEDGLADTFDGIGGGLTREASLSIMKDSRIGTYGTLALGMVVAAKLASLYQLSAALVPAVLIAGHSLSRLSSVLVLATSRYVRLEGTAKPVAGGISLGGLITAMVLGALCTTPLLWLVGLLNVAIGFGGLIVGHVAMRAFFERKLGGYTGDTLGAVQQLSELGFYIGLCLCLST